MTSCSSGIVSDMTTSAGFALKRRRSRSMMASMRCIGAAFVLSAPDDEAALGRVGLLLRVAKLAAGVVDEHVVERSALHRQRRDRDLRGVHCVEQRDDRARPVVR